MATARESPQRRRDGADVNERADRERSRARQKASPDRTGKRPVNPSIAVRRAASRAAEQVRELTGREPEGVVAISREGGEWQIAVEVVEMHRIPDSADILAIYNVDLDSRGQLLNYRRERRYIRGGTEGMK